MLSENPLKYKKSVFIDPLSMRTPVRRRCSSQPSQNGQEKYFRSIYSPKQTSIKPEESQLNAIFKDYLKITTESSSEKQEKPKTCGLFEKLKSENSDDFSRFVSCRKKIQTSHRLNLKLRKMKSKIDKMNHLIKLQDIKSKTILNTLRTSSKMSVNNGQGDAPAIKEKIPGKFQTFRRNRVEQKEEITDLRIFNVTPKESAKSVQQSESRIWEDPYFFGKFMLVLIFLVCCTVLIIYIIEGPAIFNFFNPDAHKKTHKFSVYRPHENKDVMEQIVDFFKNSWEFAKNQKK